MRALTFALLFLTSAAACGAQTSKFGIPSTSGAGAIAPPVSTVAQLPTCDFSHIGYIRVVVDGSAAPVYNATVTGGGAVVRSVLCNGTNWVNQ